MLLIFLILLFLVALAVYMVHNEKATVKGLMRPVIRGIQDFVTDDTDSTEVRAIEFKEDVKVVIQPILQDTVPPEYEPAELLTGSYKHLRMEGLPGGRRFPPLEQKVEGEEGTQDNNIKSRAVSFHLKPPNGWARGTSITPKVHFIADNNNRGVLHFNLWYKTSKVGEEVPLLFNKIGLTKTVRKGQKGIHKSMIFPTIVEETATEHNQFIFILERYIKDDTQDTYKGNIDIIDIDFEFNLKRIGTTYKK